MKYFFYNESQQTELFLGPGVYLFECWGAQGGRGVKDASYETEGGKGAYVSGYIGFNKRRKLYLYIGGKGGDGSYKPNIKANPGFNGGGYGGADTSDDASGGGGGSTDIRLVGGDWNNTEGILNRIIVAAGGSGSSFDTYGAPGGTINGYTASAKGKDNIKSSDTTQTNGYRLGIGQDGIDHSFIPSSGAGSGYYGGITSPAATTISDSYKAVSSSGTSFVSGCKDCVAIDRSGKKTDSSIHFSGLVFKNIVMLDGNSEFKSPLGVTSKGNSGDGAIKITYLFNMASMRRTRTFGYLFTYILLIYS